MNQSIDNFWLENIPDPGTDHRLLPSALRTGDNTRKHRYYKTALRQGMERCLTPVQKEHIRMYYGQGLKKSEIAARMQCGCSWVSKSIRAGEAALREYIRMYMGIYDSLEKDFLQDDNQGGTHD